MFFWLLEATFFTNDHQNLLPKTKTTLFPPEFVLESSAAWLSVVELFLLEVFEQVDKHWHFFLWWTFSESVHKVTEIFGFRARGNVFISSSRLETVDAAFLALWSTFYCVEYAFPVSRVLQSGSGPPSTAINKNVTTFCFTSLSFIWHTFSNRK